MSIEEKQNSPTYLDFENIEYPQNEREVSNFIKKNYKSNIPIEVIGLGSKKKIGKPITIKMIASLLPRYLALLSFPKDAKQAKAFF